jgi:hypothetical protein
MRVEIGLLWVLQTPKTKIAAKYKVGVECGVGVGVFRIRT